LNQRRRQLQSNLKNHQLTQLLNQPVSQLMIVMNVKHAVSDLAIRESLDVRTSVMGTENALLLKQIVSRAPAPYVVENLRLNSVLPDEYKVGRLE
jgi:hypothetical protein